MVLKYLLVIWETAGVMPRRKEIALVKVDKDKMIF